MCSICNRHDEDCICLAITAESGPASDYGALADLYIVVNQVIQRRHHEQSDLQGRPHDSTLDVR